MVPAMNNIILLAAGGDERSAGLCRILTEKLPCTAYSLALGDVPGAKILSSLSEMRFQPDLLVLPTKSDVWGLVINEAASLGTPIVSTYGSGAAVEFLSERYPQLLAKPGDAESLIASVIQLEEVDKDEFSNYLKEKSKKYSIEEGVKRHLTLMEG